MAIRAKLTLYRCLFFKIILQRWSIEDPFQIKYISNYENSIAETIAKGYTLKECIENLTNEYVSNKELFGTYEADLIIDTFELSEEDINFITELGEWADF